MISSLEVFFLPSEHVSEIVFEPASDQQVQPVLATDALRQHDRAAPGRGHPAHSQVLPGDLQPVNVGRPVEQTYPFLGHQRAIAVQAVDLTVFVIEILLLSYWSGYFFEDYFVLQFWIVFLDASFNNIIHYFVF